ncbi:MAG: hypothetical protein KatS3mg002_0839 [Candidatus Woesearchaeota archaeon]|nr:MAG: hypothetical protein KatS3mg002_0839 [Candidatus Woesearchaeota archaeon]
MEEEVLVEEDDKFDRVAENFIKEYDRLCSNNDMKLILVTHAPPYDTNLDNMGPFGGSTF